MGVFSYRARLFSKVISSSYTQIAKQTKASILDASDCRYLLKRCVYFFFMFVIDEYFNGTFIYKFIRK